MSERARASEREMSVSRQQSTGPRTTYSSSVVTRSHPPTISSLKVTDCSFRYASPRLWNQLPDSFCQPHQSCLDSPPHSLVNPSLSSSLLSASITPSLQAQNLPFQQILPTLTLLFYSLDCLHDDGTGPDVITLISLF